MQVQSCIVLFAYNKGNGVEWEVVLLTSIFDSGGNTKFSFNKTEFIHQWDHFYRYYITI